MVLGSGTQESVAPEELRKKHTIMVPIMVTRAPKKRSQDALDQHAALAEQREARPTIYEKGPALIYLGSPRAPFCPFFNLGFQLALARNKTGSPIRIGLLGHLDTLNRVLHELM